MDRVQLIKEVQRYFSLRELVDEPTYKKYGDFAWLFWWPEELETIFCLRDSIIKKPMTINNWFMGGQFSQRGLRTNLSPLVVEKTNAGKLYMTAHGNGAGIDFDVKGVPAEEARQTIIANKNRLPYPIRLEAGVNWVHQDMYNDGSKDKVVLFKV